MCELDNKEIRKEMLMRYLDAETTVAEERALVEYFMQHNPDAEESALAAMIVAESTISRVGFEENSANAGAVNHNRWVRYWWAGVAAVIAVVVTCFVCINRGNSVDGNAENATIASNNESPLIIDNKDSKPKSMPSTSAKAEGIKEEVRMPKCESQQLPEKPHRVVDDILAVLDVGDDALVSCDIAMKGDGALVTKVFAKGEKRTYLLTFDKDGEYDLIALNQ